MNLHPITRRVSRLAVAGLVVIGSTGLIATGAGAATLNGTATIAKPADGTTLGSGASNAVFTVKLPAGAACSGDTANGGYHVYSYLVHAGVDVTTVTFVNFPSQGYGFVDNSATYYGPANTAINTGQVINIPNNFQWSKLVGTDSGSLPKSELLYSGSSGVWEAGLACANSSGVVKDNWNTEVTFSASAGDANGFTWAAVPGVPAQAPEVPLPVVLPIVALAAAGITWGVGRRRTRLREAVATS
jgi:hypothetical protein